MSIKINFLIHIHYFILLLIIDSSISIAKEKLTPKLRGEAF